MLHIVLVLFDKSNLYSCNKYRLLNLKSLESMGRMVERMVERMGSKVGRMVERMGSMESTVGRKVERMATGW